MVSKRKHPKFRRPNFGRTKRSRISLSWRRPRGIDNKKREKIAYMGASPSIGYGQPKEIKHRHPQGLPEILVQTPADLHGVSNVVVRIASGVGAIKRAAIQSMAAKLGLKVVNPKAVNIKKKEQQPAKASNE
ncbi:MAG: 50S ribosomal protein L32e [Candidatus Micrarchaeota archaeon]|nr:50S ribosomal protein L32e [Candidatus Micrarchaeota archaeon]